MWICPHSKYVEVIPKVKTSQKTIPKVKNQSREIPPRWFRRWKINLVKSHRDDSEGEKSISWKFTEMIPKEKIFIEIIPKGKNWHQSQFRWNSGSQLISKVKNLKRWSSLEIWVDDPNYIRKSKRPLDIECQQRRRARRSHWCISMTKKWRTRGWSNRRNSLMEWLKR
jgi:hypothetical protein